MKTVPKRPRKNNDRRLAGTADTYVLSRQKYGGNLFSAWRSGKDALKTLTLFAAILALSGCIGTTTSSSTNFNRQLSSNSKAIAPKTAVNTAASENQAKAGSSTVARVESPKPLSSPSALAEAADAAPADGEAVFDDHFSGGLINQFACTKGLTGDLATGQAGLLLLAASGMSVEGIETLADTLATSLIMAENVSGINPAPSAGTADTADSSSTFLSGKLSGKTEGILVTAYEQAGRRYKAGGQNPAAGFDAAGFTRWVYGQRGINLPQGAKMQAAAGRHVAKEELRPGDILVYHDPSGGNEEYHVGIYTGQGNFLHAVAKSGVVTETAAFGLQYSPYFIGGRRYFDDPQAAPLSDSRKIAAASQAVKLALSELGPNDKPDRSGATSKGKAKKKK